MGIVEGVVGSVLGKGRKQLAEEVKRGVMGAVREGEREVLDPVIGRGKKEVEKAPPRPTGDEAAPKGGLSLGRLAAGAASLTGVGALAAPAIEAGVDNLTGGRAVTMDDAARLADKARELGKAALDQAGSAARATISAGDEAIARMKAEAGKVVAAQPDRSAVAVAAAAAEIKVNPADLTSTAGVPLVTPTATEFKAATNPPKTYIFTSTKDLQAAGVDGVNKVDISGSSRYVEAVLALQQGNKLNAYQNKALDDLAKEVGAGNRAELEAMVQIPKSQQTAAPAVAPARAPSP